MSAAPSPQTASHVSRRSGVNLASHQFRIVRLNTLTGYLMLPAASGDTAIGVLQNYPAADEVGDVVFSGGTKVQLGATLVPGDRFMSDNAGRAIRWTSGQHCVGTVFDGGVSGDIVAATVTNAGGVSVS